MKAIVAFHGHGEGFLSRFLKPGFRHVFVAVQSGDYWITLDGQAGVPDIKVVAASDYDLAVFYRGEGFTVVETEQRATVPRSPFAVANCVGMTKSVLCIRSGAVTPWRLYRFLRRTP